MIKFDEKAEPNKDLTVIELYQLLYKLADDYADYKICTTDLALGDMLSEKLKKAYCVDEKNKRIFILAQFWGDNMNVESKIYVSKIIQKIEKL